MTIGAKHFDPIIGVDIHIIQPPGPVPPVPVPHPFVGMVMDPIDYLPFIGATVTINGLPRAQAGSSGIASPHIPIGGTFIQPPGDEAEIFMGSATVEADGDALSFLGMPVLSCQDVGMRPPPRAKESKIVSMVLPTSVVLSIPMGRLVLVGGPPTISLTAIGMRIGRAALGRALRRLRGTAALSPRRRAAEDLRGRPLGLGDSADVVRSLLRRDVRAEYELWADYDRDGRVTGARAERNARSIDPGAILLPNLDVEARALPATVAAGDPQTIDTAQTTRNPRDNELLAVTIHARSGARATDATLAFTGWLPSWIRVFDGAGHEINREPGLNVYPLTLSGRSLNVGVEISTLAGSPLTHPSSLSTTPIEHSFDECQLTMSLRTLDASGNGVDQDAGQLKVAPFIMMDGLLPARCIYVAELYGNTPSISDLERALRGSGVPVVRVPADVDGWVQDQFHVGYCRAPQGDLLVAWHLPRMRSNAVLDDPARTRNNLAHFVRAHLPSRDLGLFDDFWKRNFSFMTASGVQSIAFEDSIPLHAALNRVWRVRRYALHLIREYAVARPQTAAVSRFSDARRGLEVLVESASAALDAKAQPPASTEGRTLFNAIAADLQRRFDQVRAEVPVVSSSHLGIRLHGGLSVDLVDGEIDQLQQRLDRVHDSLGYGGNLMASPELPGHRFGKVVLGSSRWRTIDPDVLRFLRAQRMQPELMLDTSWLEVGHVDEVIAFVPRPRAEPAFAMLCASPQIALAILDGAWAKYRRGLPIEHPHLVADHPFFDRRTSSGTSPVTRLFRGKEWLHHHLPGALESLEPPRIYQKLAEYYASPLTALEAPFRAGEGDDRHYPAALTVFEALYFGRRTNEGVEENFLADIRETLQRDLPGIPVIGLPVLFDRVNDWREQATSAFSPNLVNLQVIGRRVLMPRPYGPRMNIDDAIGVVGDVLRAGEELETRAAARLNSAFVRRAALDVTSAWVQGGTAIVLSSTFSDGFHGVPPNDVNERIRRANPSAFNGDSLRSGWHRLEVPERMVDLFELYAAAIAAELGLELSFVDSWFYHVRLGELHCGTNVLRRPPSDARHRWWTNT